MKTPRMWGWTGHTDGLQRRRRENPTYVGMDRHPARLRGHGGRKPHVCGDGPLNPTFKVRGVDENPTYVGMDRLVKAPVLHKECKPHVCGDGPILDEQEVRLTQ